MRLRDSAGIVGWILLFVGMAVGTRYQTKLVEAQVDLALERVRAAETVIEQNRAEREAAVQAIRDEIIRLRDELRAR